jgi:hypothetical protein
MCASLYTHRKSLLPAAGFLLKGSGVKDIGKTRHYGGSAKWLTLLIALPFLLAACQMPRFLHSELPDDGPPIPTSQEAARRFVEKVTEAGREGARTGESTLTITQEEATSFLTVGAQLVEEVQQYKQIESLQDLSELENIEGLQEIEGLEQWRELAAKREGLPDIRLPDPRFRLTIQEPQVYFRENGQIIVRGYGEIRNRRQPIRVVVAPRAVDGQLELDFVEGKLGPLSLPEGLFDLVGDLLTRAILAGRDYAEITEITVRSGTLTIRGRHALDDLGT